MTDHPLDIDVLTQGATVRLALAGLLDALSTARLEEAVGRLRRQGIRHLIVDLRAVDFIDSAGLHALAELDASARRNGHNTSFVRADDRVWRSLEVVGLADHLVWVEHPDELSSPAGTADHRDAGRRLGD